MIISHSKKFIFFKPMKAAGTSLEASLRGACSDIDLITQGTTEEAQRGLTGQNNIHPDTGFPIFHSHTWPSLLYRETSCKWPEYEKITVCRNPWDLCVSYYWWSMEKNKGSQLAIRECDASELVREKFRIFLDTPCQFNLPSQISELPSFESPCVWLSKISKKFIDKSITKYLMYETLQEDYDSLANILNIQQKVLPRFKSRQRVLKYPYKFYYDDHTKSLVEDAFLDFIDFFNYKF